MSAVTIFNKVPEEVFKGALIGGIISSSATLSGVFQNAVIKGLNISSHPFIFVASSVATGVVAGGVAFVAKRVFGN